MADYKKRKAYYFGDKQICNFSIFIGKMLAKTPITPNMVTMFNMLVVFPLICVASALRYKLAIMILLNLYILFDFLDGGLARMKEMYSKYGAILDIIADYLMYSIGYIFVAVALDTNIKIIIFSTIMQWTYALVTTIYIAPTIKKLNNFKKTKLKKFFEDKLGLVLGMDVSLQSLLISILMWFDFRKYVFLICGIFWCIDLIYRLLELWILNDVEEE